MLDSAIANTFRKQGAKQVERLGVRKLKTISSLMELSWGEIP